MQLLSFETLVIRPDRFCKALYSNPSIHVAKDYGLPKRVSPGLKVVKRHGLWRNSCSTYRKVFKICFW